MPRLPADFRISLKRRGGKTHRIELVRNRRGGTQIADPPMAGHTGAARVGDPLELPIQSVADERAYALSVRDSYKCSSCCSHRPKASIIIAVAAEMSSAIPDANFHGRLSVGSRYLISANTKG